MNGFRPNIGVMSELVPNAATIDVVAEYGLLCTQVVSWNLELATLDIARTLKKRAADNNVRLTAIWGGYSGPQEWNFTKGPVTLGLVPCAYRAMRVLELKKWADFATEAGAPAIITHCGFLPENMTDPAFEEVLVAIQDVAGYCKKLGIEFWFETGQETPVTLLRFIQATGLDNLGINLDPGNLLMYGKGNPLDSLRVFGKYVKAVHTKDAFPPTDGNELGAAVVVGTGCVDYPRFLPALLDLGFTGDLTIEREITGEQQIKDILYTKDYLNKLLDEYFNK